jgi:hypothetical protein
MSSTLANNFLEQLLKATVDFDSDTFKIILLDSSYVFDRVNDVGYADVIAHELATLYGYTAGGATLTGLVVAQDDTTDAGTVDWSTVNWTASGGSLVASGAIIYDDTVTAAPIANIVIGYIDFGGTQTVVSGGVLTVATPNIAING